MSPTILQELREARERGDLRPFLRRIPYAVFLGLDTELIDGEPRGLLRYTKHAIGNPLLPALHGGVIGALLETTAWLQIAWQVELLALPQGLTLTVSYLRSGKAQDLYAKATISRQGRRVISVHTIAWQDDQSRPIARASGQFLARS